MPGGAEDSEAAEGLYLRFASDLASGAHDDSREGVCEHRTEEERTIRLDESVRLRRLWSEELAAELGGRHGADFLECVGREVLCYELRAPSVAATPSGSARPLVLAGVQLASDAGLGGQLARAEPSAEKLSAEAVEALLWMAIRTRTRPVKDELRSFAGGVSVGAIYDPDEPAAFVRTMEACVGSLSGKPTTSTPANAASGVPVTPVRGLELR